MKVNLKKHKDMKASEDKLIELVTAYINNARLIGMAVSAKAISQVIYDITNDTKLTPEERIEKIALFCQTGINNDSKQQDILTDNVKIGKAIAVELAEADSEKDIKKAKKKSALERLATLFSITKEDTKENKEDIEDSNKKEED